MRSMSSSCPHSWRQRARAISSALTQLLASDVRVVTDGGGKVAAALNVLDGADRAARFLIGATRKGWREDFTLRFATINGLPGVIVDGPEGPVQTAAFEIEGDVIQGAVRGAQSGQVAALGFRASGERSRLSTHAPASLGSITRTVCAYQKYQAKSCNNKLKYRFHIDSPWPTP